MLTSSSLRAWGPKPPLRMATHANAGDLSHRSAALGGSVLSAGGAGPRRPRRGWSATANQEAALHHLAALARDYAGVDATPPPRVHSEVLTGEEAPSESVGRSPQ